MSEPFAETRGRGGAPQPALPELVGALGTCPPASNVRCVCADHENAALVTRGVCTATLHPLPGPLRCRLLRRFLL